MHYISRWTTKPTKWVHPANTRISLRIHTVCSESSLALSGKLRTQGFFLQTAAISYFPFGFEGRMWDLIVSAPDHCLSFYSYQTGRLIWIFAGCTGHFGVMQRLIFLGISEFSLAKLKKKRKKKKKKKKMKWALVWVKIEIKKNNSINGKKLMTKRTQ